MVDATALVNAEKQSNQEKPASYETKDDIYKHQHQTNFF